MGSNEQTEKKYGYYSHVSSGDISEMIGVSSSALSNRKVRDEDFPKDRNNEKGAPFYYLGDVYKWAFAHDLNINGEKVFSRDIEIMERDAMNRSLNIAIVGRARAGKSFICSYFMENTVFMRGVLSNEGSDFTQVPTKITIDGSSPYFRFFVRDDLIKDERVEEIPEEVSTYFNKTMSIDMDAPDFEDAINRIFEWLRSLHKKGIKDLEKYVSLEIATRPSDMARRIMERTGKRSIVLLDTPGVSGDYTFENLGRQDVVIIALRNEGMADFVESFEKISELVGTNTVIYSYFTMRPGYTEEGFRRAQEAGKKGIEDFEDELKTSFNKGSVIDSSISALHPSNYFLALPFFDVSEYSEGDKLYENGLEDLIVKGFSHKISAAGIRKILKESGESNKDILSFLNEIISSLNKNNIISVSEMNYDPEKRKDFLEEFKAKKHARVKSQDNYRIESLVNKTSQELLKDIKEELGKYKVEKYQDQEWKQRLIEYVYQVIDRTMKDYPGVGNGNHPFEDNPAVTMRACESVLAKELYDRLKDYEQKNGDEPDVRINVTRSYRAVLQEYDIHSASWDRVTANPYAIGSLRVLAESGFLDADCESEKELIINSAVKGLYFRAIVDIYTDVFIGINAYKQEEIISYVKKVLSKSMQQTDDNPDSK